MYKQKCIFILFLCKIKIIVIHKKNWQMGNHSKSPKILKSRLKYAFFCYQYSNFCTFLPRCFLFINNEIFAYVSALFYKIFFYFFKIFIAFLISFDDDTVWTFHLFYSKNFFFQLKQKVNFCWDAMGAFGIGTQKYIIYHNTADVSVLIQFQTLGAVLHVRPPLSVAWLTLSFTLIALRMV